MPIVDILDKNCELYGNEVCLVEINPEVTETRRVTWKEYNLIETNPSVPYRREITWNVFNEKANRFANLLLTRGVKKGDKVAILLMNCLEWLPVYFGILKCGALAVPMNYRYTADERAKTTKATMRLIFLNCLFSILTVFNLQIYYFMSNFAKISSLPDNGPVSGDIPVDCRRSCHSVQQQPDK